MYQRENKKKEERKAHLTRSVLVQNEVGKFPAVVFLGMVTGHSGACFFSRRANIDFLKIHAYDLYGHILTS